MCLLAHNRSHIYFKNAPIYWLNISFSRYWSGWLVYRDGIHQYQWPTLHMALEIHLIVLHREHKDPILTTVKVRDLMLYKFSSAIFQTADFVIGYWPNCYFAHQYWPKFPNWCILNILWNCRSGVWRVIVWSLNSVGIAPGFPTPGLGPTTLIFFHHHHVYRVFPHPSPVSWQHDVVAWCTREDNTNLKQYGRLMNILLVSLFGLYICFYLKHQPLQCDCRLFFCKSFIWFNFFMFGNRPKRTFNTYVDWLPSRSLSDCPTL